ncbi:MAG: apolipoprotein N-acyltransferase [Cellulomonadaceae bacterium]
MPQRPVPVLVAALLAVGGGVVTELAFPNQGWWALAFVGIALLVLALRGRGAPGSFLLGLLWGLGFFLPHLRWADTAVGVVPWVALSVAQALFVALGTAAWSFARRWGPLARHTCLRVLGFAVVWTAVEATRSQLPFGGFPWGRLAFSQADSPLGRLAWIAGPTLVSLAVALVGALLALTLRHLLLLRPGRAAVPLLVAFSLVCASFAVPLSAGAENGRLRVGVVQGNVSEPGLGAFANRYEVLRNHVRLTHELGAEVGPGGVDVVLWPENSSDVDPRVDAEAADWIDGAARAVGVPILIGTQEYVEGGRYNHGALWVAGQGVVQTYAKQHPVPFAEYVPIRDFVRHFSAAVDLVTHDMLAGTEPGVFELDVPRLDRTVRLADVICFEVAYDDVVHSAVRAGGEVLVVQTNNANFGYSSLSTQQLAMSRLRAIETGRATVQVSTVGVSGVIAPNGVLRQETELFTPATMVADLPLRSSLTPAVRLGAVPMWVVTSLGALLAVAGTIEVAAQRRRRRTENR